MGITYLAITTYDGSVYATTQPATLIITSIDNAVNNYGLGNSITAILARNYELSNVDVSALAQCSMLQLLTLDGCSYQSGGVNDMLSNLNSCTTLKIFNDAISILSSDAILNSVISLTLSNCPSLTNIFDNLAQLNQLNYFLLSRLPLTEIGSVVPSNTYSNTYPTLYNNFDSTDLLLMGDLLDTLQFTNPVGVVFQSYCTSTNLATNGKFEMATNKILHILSPPVNTAIYNTSSNEFDNLSQNLLFTYLTTSPYSSFQNQNLFSTEIILNTNSDYSILSALGFSDADSEQIVVQPDSTVTAISTPTNLINGSTLDIISIPTYSYTQPNYTITDLSGYATASNHAIQDVIPNLPLTVTYTGTQFQFINASSSNSYSIIWNNLEVMGFDPPISVSSNSTNSGSTYVGTTISIANADLKINDDTNDVDYIVPAILLFANFINIQLQILSSDLTLSYDITTQRFSVANASVSTSYLIVWKNLISMGFEYNSLVMDISSTVISSPLKTVTTVTDPLYVLSLSTSPLYKSIPVPSRDLPYTILEMVQLMEQTQYANLIYQYPQFNLIVENCQKFETIDVSGMDGNLPLSLTLNANKALTEVIYPTNLIELFIHKCTQLSSLPSSETFITPRQTDLTSLQRLTLSELPSMVTLYLQGYAILEDIVIETLQGLNTLSLSPFCRSIQVNNCPMESLNFAHLTILNELVLSNLHNLLILDISNCALTTLSLVNNINLRHVITSPHPSASLAQNFVYDTTSNGFVEGESINGNLPYTSGNAITFDDTVNLILLAISGTSGTSATITIDHSNDNIAFTSLSPIPLFQPDLIQYLFVTVPTDTIAIKLTWNNNSQPLTVYVDGIWIATYNDLGVYLNISAPDGLPTVVYSPDINQQFAVKPYDIQQLNTITVQSVVGTYSSFIIASTNGNFQLNFSFFACNYTNMDFTPLTQLTTFTLENTPFLIVDPNSIPTSLLSTITIVKMPYLQTTIIGKGTNITYNSLDFSLFHALTTIELDTLIGLDSTSPLILPYTIKSITLQNLNMTLGSFSVANVTTLVLKNCVINTNLIDLSSYATLTTFVFDTTTSSLHTANTCNGLQLDDNGNLSIAPTFQLTSLSWIGSHIPSQFGNGTGSPCDFFHVAQLYSFTVNTSNCKFPSLSYNAYPLLDHLSLGPVPYTTTLPTNYNLQFYDPSFSAFQNITTLYSNVTFYDTTSSVSSIVFPLWCKSITFNSNLTSFTSSNTQSINLSIPVFLQSLILANCNLPSTSINSISKPHIQSVCLDNAIHDYSGVNATTSNVDFTTWNPKGLESLQLSNMNLSQILNSSYCPALLTFVCTALPNLQQTLFPQCPNCRTLICDVPSLSVFSFFTCTSNCIETLQLKFLQATNLQTSDINATVPNLSTLSLDFNSQTDDDTIDITAICTAFPYLSKFSLLNYQETSDPFANTSFDISSLLYLDTLILSNITSLPPITNASTQYPTSLSLIQCNLFFTSQDISHQHSYLFNFKDGTSSTAVLSNWNRTLQSIDISNNNNDTYAISFILWDMNNGNISMHPMTLNLDKNPITHCEFQTVNNLYLEVILSVDTSVYLHGFPVLFSNSNPSCQDFVITNYSHFITTVSTSGTRSLTFQQHAIYDAGGEGGLGIGYPFYPPSPTPVATVTGETEHTTETATILYYDPATQFIVDENTPIQLSWDTPLTYLNVIDSTNVLYINMSCSSSFPNGQFNVKYLCICDINTDLSTLLTPISQITIFLLEIDYFQSLFGLAFNQIYGIGLVRTNTPNVDCSLMTYLNTLYLDTLPITQLTVPSGDNSSPNFSYLVLNTLTSLFPITMDSSQIPNSGLTDLSSCSATFIAIAFCPLLLTVHNEIYLTIDSPNLNYFYFQSCTYNIASNFIVQFVGLTNYMQYLYTDTTRLVDVIFKNCTFPNFDYHFMVSTFRILNSVPCSVHLLQFDTCSGLESIWFDGQQATYSSITYNGLPSIHIVISNCQFLTFVGIINMPTEIVVSTYDNTNSQLQLVLESTNIRLAELDLRNNPQLTDPANNTPLSIVLPKSIPTSFVTQPSAFCNFKTVLTYLTVVNSGNFSNILPPSCLLQYIYPNGPLHAFGFANPSNAVCFLRNTKILTPKGYVAIQQLKEHDMIQTWDGRRVPILKIRRFVKLNNKELEKEYVPYRIVKDSVGKGMPFEDVYVTANHAIYHPVYHQFVYASQLGRHATNLTCDCFPYYHFTLPNYVTDFPIANGIITESWCDELTTIPFLMKHHIVNPLCFYKGHITTLEILNHFGAVQEKLQQKKQMKQQQVTTKCPKLGSINCYSNQYV